MLKEKLINIYSKFVKIKVLHSIAGRLRISVPYLTKTPKEFRFLDAGVKNLIKLKDGIEDIDISYITGNVLITYDKEKLNEKIIIEWLEKIWKNVLDLYSQNPNISLDDIKKVEEILTEKLTKNKR